MSEADRYPEAVRRAAPPGSSAYYALRLAPARHRPALAAVIGLTAELRRIPAEAREADIARARAGWWRAEIDRILGGGGSHPLAEPLRGAIADHGLPGADLRALVDATDHALDGQPASTEAERAGLARRHAGAPLRLAARILAGGDADTRAYAEAVGLAAGGTRVLRLQGIAARAGRSDLSLERLEQAGVGPETSLVTADGRAAPELEQAVEDEARALARAFEQAHRAAPTDRARRRALRPVAAYAAIHEALLAEIRDQGAEELIRGRITLPPLRKVWLAWRARPGRPALARGQRGA